MWIRFLLVFPLLAGAAFAETLVEDWEEEPWRLRLFEVKPDQAEASLDSESPLNGKRCLRLRYVFDNRGADGKKVLAEAAVVTREFAQPLDFSRARGLTVCVKGAAPSLRLWVEEADGDVLVFPVPGEKTGSWARRFIPLDDRQARLRPSGNGRWDGWARVKSISFEVTDAPKTEYKNVPDGEVLYLDELSMVEK